MITPEQENTGRAELEEMMLRLAQREYRKCCEVGELTGQMAEALDRNDQTSFGMLLKMRGEAMTESEKARRDQGTLLKAYSDFKSRFEELGNGREVPDMSGMEKRILALALSRKEALSRAKEFDRRVSRRLAGDRSYYSS